jgi:hypothetical protein
VVIGAAVENFCVEVRSRVVDEAVEEVCHEFGLEVAYEANFDQIFIDQGWTATQVYGYYSQGFVHRHDEVSGAVDSFAVTQGFGKELAYDYANILHGVVLVYVQIAHGFEFEIEAAMFGEELEHVVEEADSGGNFVASAAFDAEFSPDLRFLRIALQLRRSGQAPAPVH